MYFEIINNYVQEQICISFVRSPLSISRVKNKKNPDLNFEQTKINNNNYHTKGLSKRFLLKGHTARFRSWTHIKCAHHNSKIYEGDNLILKSPPATCTAARV